MDVSDLTLADWPALGGLGEAPEALTAALISAVATLGLILFFAQRLPIARGGAHPARRDAAACEFLINGASVKPLTEPARALLDSLAPGGPRLAALTVHLAGDCPDIQPDLEALVLYGTGFRRHCPRGDGTAFEVVGEPRGGAAFLSVRPASEEARALRETETELAPRRSPRCGSCATCSTMRRCSPGATAPTARWPGRTPPTATASTRRPATCPTTGSPTASATSSTRCR